MKTPPERLLEEVADDFHTYLSKGVRFQPLLDDIDPNLQIDDLEKLLRIHFVCTESTGETPGVIDFVIALPDRIRRLKTTVSRDVQVRQGEVRGRIDWQETIKHRYRGGGSETTEFAAQETRTNYDIDENIVLSTLLSEIDEIVTDDLYPALQAPDEYAWLSRWTDADAELVRTLEQVVERNVYLERITEGAEVTDRMLRSVKRSRNPLYSEAAQLLDRYRRLLAYDLDPTDAKELLRSGFVAPDRPELLFELYWVFRILGCYPEARFRLIEDQRGVVADWETENGRYVMSHDSTGTAALQFSEDLERVEAPEQDGYLSRTLAVAEHWQTRAQDSLGISGTGSLWGGRPDILLERYTDDDTVPDAVFVGEVKYTRKTSYAGQGLRELLEYMAYMRAGETYLSPRADLFTDGCVRGGLFVDALDTDVSSDGPITIAQFGDEVEQPL